MFITFEGCDGSGKTTQVSLLQKYFIANNQNCIITREPGGTEIAEKIRQLLLSKEIEDPLTEFLLFTAARREHTIKVLKPALDSGKIVLCDRYVDSSLVYQGLQKGADLHFMLEIHKRAVDFCEPDITFVLDVEPEVAKERLEHRLATKALVEGLSLILDVEPEVAKERLEEVAKKERLEKHLAAEALVGGLSSYKPEFNHYEYNPEFNHYDLKPLEFYQGIRENFLLLSNADQGDRIKIIDANRSIEEVSKSIMHHIRCLLSTKKPQ